MMKEFLLEVLADIIGKFLGLFIVIGFLWFIGLL